MIVGRQGCRRVQARAGGGIYQPNELGHREGARSIPHGVCWLLNVSPATSLSPATDSSPGLS